MSRDRLDTIADMVRYISDNGVTSYAEFVRYCADENRDWFALVADKVEFFVALIEPSIFGETVGFGGRDD